MYKEIIKRYIYIEQLAGDIKCKGNSYLTLLLGKEIFEEDLLFFTDDWWCWKVAVFNGFFFYWFSQKEIKSYMVKSSLVQLLPQIVERPKPQYSVERWSR